MVPIVRKMRQITTSQKDGRAVVGELGAAANNRKDYNMDEQEKKETVTKNETNEKTIEERMHELEVMVESYQELIKTAEEMAEKRQKELDEVKKMNYQLVMKSTGKSELTEEDALAGIATRHLRR